MSDNSDFMSRYLPPEGPSERSDPGPAPSAAHAPPPVLAPPVPPPPPLRPAPPPPAGLAHPAGPPAAPLSSAVGRPEAPPTNGNGSGAAVAPPAWSVPAGQAAGPPDAPAGDAPGVGDHRRLTAAQRWAPQADPQAGSYSHRHIEVGEVRKARRVPPQKGWRKAVYVSSGHLLNLGAGPAERLLLDQQDRIKANIPGNYQISAISIKGGVGKTTLVAGVGTAFRLFRSEPVIAIDANPTYGALGRLVDPDAVPSLREFVAASDLTDYPKARFFTGQNGYGLEVLAGNQNVANPLELTPKVFGDMVARARRFYQLSLVDCGAEIDHQVIPEVLSASDALMIVGSMNLEGGLAVEKTLDWLASRNGHELLKRSVVVLNDAYRCASKKYVTHLTQTLGPRVRSVKIVPWDAHLRDASPLDFDALRARTRSALIDLAAELATGFPTAGALSR